MKLAVAWLIGGIVLENPASAAILTVATKVYITRLVNDQTGTATAIDPTNP